MRLLTLTRIWNLILVGLSYYVTRISKRTIHWGNPYSISIEPTTSCNLRCPECPSGLRQFSRNTGMLSMDLYRKILGQLKDRLIYMILYFQGEPYLNPRFFEFIRFAKQDRIYTATSTNGHFLSDDNAKKTIESGLDRLIISLDGIGQQEYATYRIGGRYDIVIQGIRSLVRWKKELKSGTPHIIVQFIVFRSNEHQLGEVKKLCREIGVDELQFKTAQIYDYKKGNPLIPTLDKYSRYRKMPDGSYEFKNKLPNRCFRMWSSCVITWDGITVPCCFDKDADHKMGDLKEKPFSEVWRSKMYYDFRTRVFTNRKQTGICQNCTEGM
ncbi:MAG: radical SAM protein [Bacteroidetes bacterium]|nr:radical SAM protein [Bacteroidota bacterium]